MEDPELTEVVSAEVVEADSVTPSERKHFPKHERTNKGGRPKGRPNNVTLQIREAATKLVSDPVYWRKLRSDLRKRKVHPQVETTLLAYAFGKPIERVELGRVGDFSKLSDDELMAQFEATVRSLKGEGGGKLRSA